MSKQVMMASRLAMATALETKDEGKGKSETKELDRNAVREFMEGFEEYKSTNDRRLKDIEAKNGSDVIDEEKLGRIDAMLDSFEDLNKSVTLTNEKLSAMDLLKKQLEHVEKVIARSDLGGGETKESRVDDWARAVVGANNVGINNLEEKQKKVLQDCIAEAKALNISTDTQGGYLAPMEYVRELIKGITEMSPVRSLARVRTTGQKTVQIPKRTGQFAAQWVSELGNKTETTGLTYGLEEIPTHQVYALVDITNDMLEDTVFNMEEEISMEGMEQFSVAEGAAFVNGSGVGKPEGYMVNADVAEINSGAAAAITADSLLTLKYGLKTGYTANAHYTLNRTTIGSVRKLKDANNQYLWMPGLAQGRPNTIDGDPYVEMPDMEDEAANSYPVAYGDFRRGYTWVDRLAVEMLRDPYTQATANNVRFILRKRVGGQVTLAEAIRKLKCST